MTDVHIPLRPAWSCSSCAIPWPCPRKRERLLAAYLDSPVSLRVNMSLRLADAAEDLRGLSAGALFDRFLAWVPGATMPRANPGVNVNRPLR